MIFFILKSHTAISISHTIPCKSSAFKQSNDNLILFSRHYFIHQAGSRHIRWIFQVPEHNFFWNKLIKAGIREKIHPVSGPGLCTGNGWFRSRKKFHRTHTPKFFQVILITPVISACYHESFQMKQILGFQRSVFLLAFLLCPQDPQEHVWLILQKF